MPVGKHRDMLAAVDSARPSALLAVLLFSSAVAPVAAGPGDSPGTVLVAHRGLSKVAPENTMAAYAAAAAQGFGFEVDVRRTRDGVLVSLHDPEIGRTTDGKGRVGDLTAAELARFDAGRRFGPKFAGERVPTLDAVFAWYAKRPAAGASGGLIVADIKDPGIEPALRELARRHGLAARIVCIGLALTDAEMRRKLRESPHALSAAALAHERKDLPAAIAAPHADWVLVRFAPTAEDVATVHRAGRRVILAGDFVKNPDVSICQATVAARADAVLTDYAPQCSPTSARAPRSPGDRGRGRGRGR